MANLGVKMCTALLFIRRIKTNYNDMSMYICNVHKICQSQTESIIFKFSLGNTHNVPRMEKK